MTWIGSGLEMLDLTNFLNFLCCVVLCDTKVLMLLLKNGELPWAKSMNLISCCNEKWLELNSFFKTLKSDFLWWISCFDNINWHCLYIKEIFTNWVLTWKFKELGMALLSLHINKNSKSSSTLCRGWDSF